MRALLVIAAVAALTATAGPSRAQTDPGRIPYYPWCSVWWDADSEHRSCGFTSQAQCMVNARLDSSMCFENIWANPPTAAGAVPLAQKPARRR